MEFVGIVGSDTFGVELRKALVHSGVGVSIQAFDAIEVGDALNAGSAVALASGMNLEKVLQRATAAISVMRVREQSSLPTLMNFTDLFRNAALAMT